MGKRKLTQDNHTQKQQVHPYDFSEEPNKHIQSIKHDRIMKLNHPLTAQQSRLKMAKQMISKMKDRKQATKHDDFFIEEEQYLPGSQGDYDQQFSQKLKQHHLRQQNKLYETLAGKMVNLVVDDPVVYTGHTKCITALEITPQYIYSCSKDKSVIRWNRQTKTKDFITLGKQPQHHTSDILCLAKATHTDLIATAGEDTQVKLWDTRNNQLVHTFQGHKNTVNGLKFGYNSNNLCSVSSDITVKQWDFLQKGLIETFYQHNAEVLDVDFFNGNDFLTAGNDHQSILWKTEKETKIIFKGHQYAIDRCRTINQQKFITASQDGSINLWSSKRVKPVFKIANAHKQGWISALDNIKQSDMFATGAVDKTLKIWKIEGEMKSAAVLMEIPMQGIITDLKMDRNWVAATECDQLRLGRWVTQKCRNKIKVFNFHY